MAKPLQFGRVTLAPGTFTTAAGLVLAGAAGAVVAPPWSAPDVIANTSIALGLLLFAWGTKINRYHLWQPWWKGLPNPFLIKAWYRPWDYEEGKDVGGIPWSKAFAHIRVNITNASTEAVHDLSARLMPDQPILKSTAKCEFAECRIGLDREPVDITIRAKLKDGRTVDIPPSQLEQVLFGPPHLLVCDRLPAGATIEIHLATVVPNEPGSDQIVRPVRTDPEYIAIALKWQLSGDYSVARGRFSLGSHDVNL